MRFGKEVSVLKFYEEEALAYDYKRQSDAYGGYLWRRQREAVLDLCGDLEHKRLLEVGVGTGRFALELAKNGAEVFGLDAAGAMLQVTKKKAGEKDLGAMLHLIRGDGIGLPFKDASFDGVISIHVLNHLPRHRDTLREMKRVLKPGGFIVVGIPNLLSFAFPAAIYVNITRHAIGSRIYSYHFTRRGMKKALREAGFVVEEVRGNMLLPPWLFPGKLLDVLAWLDSYASNHFLNNFSQNLIMKARSC